MLEQGENLLSSMEVVAQLMKNVRMGNRTVGHVEQFGRLCVQ